MTLAFGVIAQQTMGLPVWRGLLATLIVLGLLGALVWLVSKGRLGLPGRRGGAISVESSCSLGERRLLVIVGVDGRRLLLGVATDHVSLLTELAPPPTEPFAAVLEKSSDASLRGPA